MRCSIAAGQLDRHQRRALGEKKTWAAISWTTTWMLVRQKSCRKPQLRQKPVLGICRGFQMINVFFGGSLYQGIASQGSPQGRAYSGEVSRYRLCSGYFALQFVRGAPLYKFHPLSGRQSNTPLSANRPSLVQPAGHGGRAGSFLRLCQEGAITETPSDCIIEAAVHESLPIVGLQWHPEILLKNPAHAADAKKILRRFLEL